MRIQRIEGNNFISYKNISLTLPDSNLFLITGPNASGKSSLIESFFWGLFGKSHRNSLDKHIPNATNPEKASISVFTKDLRITRGKNPPLLEFQEFGGTTRESKITETQQKLNKKLGGGYKIFENCSFYDESSSGFLDLSLEEKREFISSYVDVGDFFALKKCAREKRLGLEKSLAGFNFLIESLKDKKTPSVKMILGSYTLTKLDLEERISLYKFWESSISEDNLLYSRLFPFYEEIKKRIGFYTKILFAEEIFVQLNIDYSINLSIDGKEIGIRSLSTSQRKRVNMAISLAFKDFLRENSDIQVDTLFFDEIVGFDSDTNLRFVNLLKFLAQKFQVFVITQDKDLRDKLSEAIIIEVNVIDGFSVASVKQ